MAVPRSRATSTRDQILSATRAVLNRDGAGDLSTRSIAAEAGVNLSLIHYYFRSREGLLLAVLEQMNTELLQRQRRMYADPRTSLTDKWRQAARFYRGDLRSGYVRTLLEIAAAGYSSPKVAAAVRTIIRGWRELLTEVAAEALPRLGIGAVTPDEAASAIVSFWYGMELQHLLNVPEQEGRLWKTLDGIGRLLDRLETA